MRTTLPLTIGLVLLSGNALAWGDKCEFSADRALDIDPGAALELALSAGAGDLEVRGDASITRIELRGRACASSQALLDQLQLVSQASGQRIEAEVGQPDINDGGRSDYARMDLVVVMPARMQLDLRDSSGDLSVESLAAAKVADSSGDIRIRDIGGLVQIADSSGDINVTGVRGDVVVTSDSSGDIEIDEVAGRAVVEVDSSGDVEFRDIKGDARVGHDSSGDIEFNDIGGHALVGSDGSGSIRAVRVVGDFKVDKDGSGQIAHRDVGGQVNLPAR